MSSYAEFLAHRNDVNENLNPEILAEIQDIALTIRAKGWKLNAKVTKKSMAEIEALGLTEYAEGYPQEIITAIIAAATDAGHYMQVAGSGEVKDDSFSYTTNPSRLYSLLNPETTPETEPTPETGEPEIEIVHTKGSACINHSFGAHMSTDYHYEYIMRETDNKSAKDLTYIPFYCAVTIIVDAPGTGVAAWYNTPTRGMSFFTKLSHHPRNAVESRHFDTKQQAEDWLAEAAPAALRESWGKIYGARS